MNQLKLNKRGNLSEFFIRISILNLISQLSSSVIYSCSFSSVGCVRKRLYLLSKSLYSFQIMLVKIKMKDCYDCKNIGLKSLQCNAVLTRIKLHFYLALFCLNLKHLVILEPT
jgi:hypothetical protein